MSTFETKIQQYMDAGFPIIYLHTFEAEKAKSAIKAAAGNSEDILVWDGTDRVLNIQGDRSSVKYEMIRLPEFLEDRMEIPYQNKRQIIVLQSIETFVDDSAVVARLSKIAGCIYNGLDATVFVLSPVMSIPREIEKYITVLEMDYLSTDAVIRNNDQVVTTGSTLYPRGLILGYVVDAGLDGTGVAKYAIIEPASDLDSLEQVFIITQYVNE